MHAVPTVDAGTPVPVIHMIPGRGPSALTTCPATSPASQCPAEYQGSFSSSLTIFCS
jgi:hypothetical protein